jgi:serine phosphatase RsbU (regulator of sigma subunit)
MVILNHRVLTREDAVRVRGALVRLAAELPLDPAVRAALIARVARELRRIVAGGGGSIRVRLEDADQPPAIAPATTPADDATPDDDLVLEPLLDVIQEQRDALAWHQSELAQTNVGLLALHAELEAQRGQLAFLDEVNRATAASLDGERILVRLSELLIERGVATAVSAWFIGEDGRLRRGVGSVDRRDRPAGAVTTALRSRDIIGEGSLRLFVPLTIGRVPLGVLELARDRSPFTAEDTELARHVAARVAVTLRNAWEYEQERDLAEALQQALLPSLPAADGMVLAAHYRPATQGANVGGDWYDAFRRADDRLVMAVGDVTGHGIEATVLMGQLQNALRAYAMEGHDPATTLALLDRMLRAQARGLFATAVVAELHIPSRRLRWAGAGHLPPAVCRADRTVRFLDQPQAPMLGLPVEFGQVQHETELPSESTLLLFTDGLIERRDSDIDAGLARLARSLGALGDGDPATTAEWLVDDMVNARRHEDDVCVLLCRHTGADGTVSVNGRTSRTPQADPAEPTPP